MDSDFMDRELSIAQAENAYELLVAAGFIVDPAQCIGTPRSILWKIGITSRQRQRVASELLELVLDDENAA